MVIIKIVMKLLLCFICATVLFVVTMALFVGAEDLPIIEPGDAQVQWLPVAVPTLAERMQSLGLEEIDTFTVTYSATCMSDQTPIWVCGGDYYCVSNADIVAGRIPEDKLHLFPLSEEECRN